MNNTVSQSRQWVSGSWVSGSNGSLFLDGSHGSWVNGCDPLTHCILVNLRAELDGNGIW